MTVTLKYGLGEVSLDIPREKIVGVLEPAEKKELGDTQAKVKKALQNPLRSKRLKEIVKPGDKIVVVIDDITRPLPSADILPALIEELTSAGIRKEDVTIIVATGLHRKLKDEQIKKLVGKKVASSINTVNHGPYSRKNLAHVGRTSRGSEVYLNRNFIEADVKILVGDIEYHQFFGYGGGAKSIHPGIADADSIRDIHSRLDSPRATAGILNGNPIQEELKEVVQMVSPDFALNVVLDSKKEVVEAFTGDLFEVFHRGVKLVDEIYKVKVSRRVDTVIASCGGYPRDINLYQSQKAVESAIKVLKQGGRVVLFARCQEGWGSKVFQEWMKEARSPQEIIEKIKQNFTMGAHKAYLLAKEVRWADVYLYSQMRSSEVKDAFVHPVLDLEEVDQLLEEAKEIAVLPRASTTLPWVGEN